MFNPMYARNIQKRASNLLFFIDKNQYIDKKEPRVSKNYIYIYIYIYIYFISKTKMALIGTK